jgi:integrase/recombinase XerD
MLGHASLETTSIYTLVSIKKLKEVHELTHPGAHLGRRENRQRPAVSEKEAEELLSSLAAEAEEEDRV